MEPAVLDPATQLGDRGRRGVEGHGRRLGDRVGLDSADPGTAAQDRLDHRFLRRTEHAAHVQHGGGHLGVGAGRGVPRPGQGILVILLGALAGTSGLRVALHLGVHAAPSVGRPLWR